jgi:small-conductance mechanosensitive channel
MSLFEICLYLFFYFALHITQSVFNNFQQDSRLLTLFMTLAWLCIVGRLSYSLSKHSPQARFIAIILWSIVLFAFFGSQSETLLTLKNISFSIGNIEINLLKIIESIIIFTILMWAAKFLSVLTKKEIEAAHSLTNSHKVLYAELARVAFYVTAIGFGFAALGIDLTVLTVFSGTLGFGIGIGLSRIISNFISGIVLLLDKSIKPGDLLQIEGVRGTVNQMHPRYVSVITRDGQNILVPNEAMMNDKVRNLSYDTTFMQLNFNLSLVYGSDVLLVKKVAEEVLENDPDILQSPLPSCHLSELTESCIKFQVKYWVDETVAHPSAINHNLLILLMDAFSKNNIELFTHSPPQPKKSEEAVAPEPKAKPKKSSKSTKIKPNKALQTRNKKD